MVKGTRFTDKFIMNLKPAEKEYWTREGQGFSIRVLPSGEKVWYFIYTFEGRKRFMKLKDGGYPDVSLADAREAFDVAKVKVKNGIDPLAEKQHEKEERRKAPMVADLVNEYVERHAKRFKRSWAKDEQILNREVVSTWGQHKAADITKRDVNQLLEKIVDRGAPIMANNTFAVIRKMYNWAIEQDILQYTPCIGVKPPAPKVSRERVLSETEIKTLWTNLDRTDLNISTDSRRALKMILVTAQRPGEVIGMHSSEIDDQWWTIPAERAKNGKMHRVYLTATALELIGDATGKDYIFPTPHKDTDKPIGDTALAVAVGRNLAIPLTDSKGKSLYDSDGKPATENRLGIDHFTPHDLRRSAATFMAGMGFMDEIIDAVLNHVKKGIIRTYNRHDYDKEKQQALEAWERKLNSIIASSESNVIPMRRKTA
jgi:integrase